MPAWTAPYVLAILIALIVIIVVLAVRSRRPNGGYYTGGYVSGDRISHIPMLMRSSSQDSAFMHVLRKHLRRSNFHPTTRRVLETLDRLQRPEVDEVISPKLVEDAIMPELRNNYLGVAVRDIRQGEMIRERDIQPIGFFVSTPGYDEPAVFVRGDPHNINEFLAPGPEDVWADEGEPLATPPAPNIGTEAVPYAGPNYVEPIDLVEEMKGIVHYGRDDEQ